MFQLDLVLLKFIPMSLQCGEERRKTGRGSPVELPHRRALLQGGWLPGEPLTESSSARASWSSPPGEQGLLQGAAAPERDGPGMAAWARRPGCGGRIKLAGGAWRP
jgi:hypothetical protein